MCSPFFKGIVPISLAALGTGNGTVSSTWSRAIIIILDTICFPAVCLSDTRPILPISAIEAQMTPDDEPADNSWSSDMASTITAVAKATAIKIGTSTNVPNILFLLALYFLMIISFLKAVPAGNCLGFNTKILQPPQIFGLLHYSKL